MTKKMYKMIMLILIVIMILVGVLSVILNKMALCYSVTLLFVDFILFFVFLFILKKYKKNYDISAWVHQPNFYKKCTLLNLMNDLNYSRRKLNRLFDMTLEPTDIAIIKSHAQLQYYDLTPTLNAIRFYAVMRSQEAENLFALLKSYGYLTPTMTRKGLELYHSDKNSVILSIEQSPFRDPILAPNPEMTDTAISLITNDLALLNAINLCKFSMTPPWFIFSDLVFGHRHGPWRSDWERFWDLLSDDEKATYLTNNPPPKEWLDWLTNGNRLF